MLLNTRATLFGIEQSSWDEFDKRVFKISDKQIKAYLYVKALYALDAQKQRTDLFADYLRLAERNLEAIEDKKSKAKGDTVAEFNEPIVQTSKLVFWLAAPDSKSLLSAED